MTCTFNNTAQGQIKIVKNTTGGNGAFNFTVSGPSGSTPSITTLGGTGTTGLFTVTAGSYAVSESAQANWVLTSSDCGGSSPADFTVPVGGSVTCTFNNTAQGKIRINKTAVGGDATFGFAISGPERVHSQHRDERRDWNHRAADGDRRDLQRRRDGHSRELGAHRLRV